MQKNTEYMTMQEQHQIDIQPRLRTPSQYKVLLLNDDLTPMDFVIELLETIFQKNEHEATALMYEVHEKGSAVCGIYTFEIAETKVGQALEKARQEQHPLQCRLEKA